MTKENYVCELNSGQSELLKQILIDNNWDIDQIPHSNWRARKNKTTATSYCSGKLVIQGKETANLVQFIIEPEILKEARFGYETYWAKQENPDMFKPHAGIDESVTRRLVLGHVAEMVGSFPFVVCPLTYSHHYLQRRI